MKITSFLNQYKSFDDHFGQFQFTAIDQSGQVLFDPGIRNEQSKFQAKSVCFGSLTCIKSPA